MISALFLSRPRVTPIPCISLAVLTVAWACLRPFLPNLQLKAQRPYARSRLLYSGLQLFVKLSHAIYKLLSVRTVATSAYPPNGNGGVERISHTMAKMFVVVVSDRRNDWDTQLFRT